MKKLQLNKKTVKNLAVRSDVKAGRYINPPKPIQPPEGRPSDVPTFCVTCA